MIKTVDEKEDDLGREKYFTTQPDQQPYMDFDSSSIPGEGRAARKFMLELGNIPQTPQSFRRASFRSHSASNYVLSIVQPFGTGNLEVNAC